MTQRLNLSPSEYEFIAHRLTASDAIAEALTDDASDDIARAACHGLYDQCQRLETLLHRGCDAAELSELDRAILRDCIEGATILSLAQDEEPFKRGLYGRTVKAGRGAVAKLAAIGIDATLPE